MSNAELVKKIQMVGKVEDLLAQILNLLEIDKRIGIGSLLCLAAGGSRDLGFTQAEFVRSAELAYTQGTSCASCGKCDRGSDSDPNKKASRVKRGKKKREEMC